MHETAQCSRRVGIIPSIRAVIRRGPHLRALNLSSIFNWFRISQCPSFEFGAMPHLETCLGILRRLIAKGDTKGKSITSLAVMGILPAAACVARGRVRFAGRLLDLNMTGRPELRSPRGPARTSSRRR